MIIALPARRGFRESRIVPAGNYGYADLVEFRYCDETSFGFSWVVKEHISRTSHALTDGGQVWIVDPVDWPEAVERACALGRLAGVLQLLGRHNRDCASVAERLGVAHLVAPAAIPASPFEVVVVKRARRWNEIALWWPERRVLVVAEAIASNPFFPVAGDPIGVHPMLKLSPPRLLGRFEPEHLLVGHGEGLHGPASATALHTALERSRVRTIQWAAALPLQIYRARRD